jgi:hypothetical protein
VKKFKNAFRTVTGKYDFFGLSAPGLTWQVQVVRGAQSTFISMTTRSLS